LGQVVSQVELVSLRGGWKRNGQVVVCVSGGFDLLHPGHTRILEQARALGDALVVAVESDAQIRQAISSTRAASGGSFAPVASKIARPITPTAERAEIIASLACVDCVVEIDASLQEFLSSLEPEILAVGKNSEVAALINSSWKVVRIPLEPGFSTTGLIERITQLSSK
jgi:cytidyltransferase-like protein